MRVNWTPTNPDKWGGAYRIASTEWDWSAYNRLSLWLATNYTQLGLNLSLSILDVNSISWDVTRENVNGTWTEYVFDLDGFTGNLSRVKEIYITFTGVSGSVMWNVSVDYISYYRVKILEETGYANQTFTKANVTENVPGNVVLSYDVLIESRMNVVDSNLALLVSNSTSNFTWEKDLVTPPYSNHVTVDLSWLMTEAGDYDISLQLHLSVFTRLASRYSARFDNITVIVPNRNNGTYLSEPYDTLSQSLWKDITWNEGPQDPETNIS
ncbi:MAG: hypothetical protein KAW09_02460, partial [Thermoplasmata archaeon]|nr:hypothetical protein [Thermoplasmata archaeon]